MRNNTIMVKIGGKILENNEDLNATIFQLQSLIEEGYIQSIVIIAGGGTWANFIRQLDNEFKLGDDLSHWMAIYAMDLNGIHMQEDFPFINLINDFKKLRETVSDLNNNPISIFLPYNYLKEKDPLPHSWDVTSDSINIFFAKELGLNESYLIKDVDGLMYNDGETIKLVKNLSTDEYKKFANSHILDITKDNYNDLKKSMPIDSYSLTLITKYKIPCIVLNGTESKLRIQNYFKEKKEDDKYYTKIF